MVVYLVAMENNHVPLEFAAIVQHMLLNTCVCNMSSALFQSIPIAEHILLLLATGSTSVPQGPSASMSHANILFNMVQGSFCDAFNPCVSNMMKHFQCYPSAFPIWSLKQYNEPAAILGSLKPHQQKYQTSRDCQGQ